MTILNCEIFECGKNILGKCSEQEVTLSLKNICSKIMITSHDREKSIPPEIEDRITEMEEDLHRYESSSYEMEELQDEIDRLENEVYILERKLKPHQNTTIIN